MLFHSLVPSYNIIMEVVRRKSIAYEDLPSYIERLVEALTKAVKIIEKSNKSRDEALMEVFRLVEKVILPLELDLIDLRNTASILPST